MMKRLLCPVVCGLMSVGSVASAAHWQPAAGHVQLPIWPAGKVPNNQRGSGPLDELTQQKSLIAGRPWLQIANVMNPTMTVYKPKKNATGAAVIVFPGGGYMVLAIDLEGTDACDWLTSRGITCVLLKYRVPGLGHYKKSAPHFRSGPYPKSPIALQDAQRTIGVLRP